MQKMLYLFLCCFLSLSAIAQPYYVVSVKGDVSADGKQLEKKDKIAETAQLRFGSADAFAYVVSPGKGYYVLSPKKQRAQQENEFLLSLKEALLPPTEFNTTSTRNARLVLPLSFGSEADMQRFFRHDLRLIGGTRFQVPDDRFPLDSTHYFALQEYREAADTSQLHPLPDSSDILILDEAALPSIATSGAPVEASLIYCDRSTGEMQPVGQFNLTLLPRSSVLQELRQLYEAVTPIPTEVFLRDHARPYLDKVYGAIPPEVVRQLVEGAFGKKN